MRGTTLIYAVIAGITGVTLIACSATMEDLSSGAENARPGEASSSGSTTETPTSSEILDASIVNANDDDDAAVVDNKLDPLSPDAGGALAPNCKIIELTPTTVVSAGAGQGWQSAASAIADDNVSATASLSTDNRDSAQLIFGGFTGEAIPATATVKGFMVIVDRSSGGSCIQANGIGASIVGNVRIKAVNDSWQGITFYGDFDDLWGGPIAPTDFGGSFQVGLGTRLVGTQSQCNPRDARVDALRVRVQFCTT